LNVKGGSHVQLIQERHQTRLLRRRYPHPAHRKRARFPRPRSPALYAANPNPADWTEQQERKIGRHIRYRTAQTNILAKYRKARTAKKAAAEKSAKIHQNAALLSSRSQIAAAETFQTVL
jgi:hypothetical protein